MALASEASAAPVEASVLLGSVFWSNILNASSVSKIRGQTDEIQNFASSEGENEMDAFVITDEEGVSDEAREST